MVRRKNTGGRRAVEVGGSVVLTEADALSYIEKAQKAFSKATSRTERSAIGQFLTPAPIARFMASLFERGRCSCAILDPGAGTGSLFGALTER